MKKRNLVIGIGGAIGAAIAVKMLTRPRHIVWEQVAGAVEHSENSHFVSIDGARVHFQEFGDTAHPPLILIHGYTASTYVWKTTAPLLAAAGFRVIAVDLLGFGYSEKPAWFDYTIQAQARMVTRFMDRLGLGRATIIGSSYGGAVAATIALDNPERVEKLVLVDAVINDEAKDHPLMKLAKLPGLGEMLTPFIVDSKIYTRLRMHGTMAESSHHLIDRERVNSVLRPLAAADGHHSVLATARNWDAERIERDAGLIDQPTLIIWGDEDSVIDIRNGYKLHESVLNSRFVIFKDCGHVPQEEKSELFADVVTEFCRDKKGRIQEPTDERLRMES